MATDVVIRPPSAELIAGVRGEICTAMFMAGSSAYFAWLDDQGEEPDVGELVSQVYGAMRAQEISILRQIAQNRKPQDGEIS